MEKILCGSAKTIPTQYGELTKVSFSKEDINKMVTHMKETGSGWINLVIKEKKNKVEGKPTHYLEVDTWKSEAKQATAQKVSATASTEDSDSLPF